MVEVAFGIMVLGILAAVAVPTFLGYAARSRTAEAPRYLAAIALAEVTYFNHSAERPDATGTMPPRQFLATEPCPEGPPAPTRRPGNWNAGAWPYLGFTVEEPVYYTYQVTSSGAGAGATATVVAHGDLDGDGITSTFLRTLTVDPNGAPVQGPLLYLNELE